MREKYKKDLVELTDTEQKAVDQLFSRKNIIVEYKMKTTSKEIFTIIFEAIWHNNSQSEELKALTYILLATPKEERTTTFLKSLDKVTNA